MKKKRNITFRNNGELVQVKLIPYNRLTERETQIQNLVKRFKDKKRKLFPKGKAPEDLKREKERLEREMDRLKSTSYRFSDIQALDERMEEIEGMLEMYTYLQNIIEHPEEYIQQQEYAAHLNAKKAGYDLVREHRQKLKYVPDDELSPTSLNTKHNRTFPPLIDIAPRKKQSITVRAISTPKFNRSRKSRKST